MPMPLPPTIPDTPAIRAARDFGVDIGALVATLATETPRERIARVDALNEFARQVTILAQPASSLVAAQRAARLARTGSSE